MAPLHGDGRVLPEWTVAHVDRLVHAASAALVPRRDGGGHTGDGVGDRVDDVSAAAVAHRVFFDRDAVGDRRDPHGELHLSELRGAFAWIHVFDYFFHGV